MSKFLFLTLLFLFNMSVDAQPQTSLNQIKEHEAFTLFKELCIEGDMEPRNWLQDISEYKLNILPEEVAANYPWGIVGQRVFGWHDEANDIVIIYYSAGKIRPEAREVHQKGGIGRAQPIDRTEDIRVIESQTSHSGIVHCSVFGEKQLGTDFITQISNIVLENKQIGYPVRQHDRNGIGRKKEERWVNYSWNYKAHPKKMRINFSHDNKRPFDNKIRYEISASWALPLIYSEF